jgi:hypothetical protein
MAGVRRVVHDGHTTFHRWRGHPPSLHAVVRGHEVGVHPCRVPALRLAAREDRPDPGDKKDRRARPRVPVNSSHRARHSGGRKSGRAGTSGST